MTNYDPNYNPFESDGNNSEPNTETTIVANETYINITETTHNDDGSISQTAEIIKRED